MKISLKKAIGCINPRSPKRVGSVRIKKRNKPMKKSEAQMIFLGFDKRKERPPLLFSAQIGGV